MNFSFFIARRYFKTRKKKGFINLISNISMIGVAVGTMALVVVLSVFNGLEDLIRSLFSSFDADLKIELVEGKSFDRDQLDLTNLAELEEVAFLTEVIEDDAFVKYKDAFMFVKMKGVSDNFVDQKRLNQANIRGDFKLKDGKNSYAIIGRGVQYTLSINPDNDFYALQFYYPRQLRAGVTNPDRIANRRAIMPSAVFSIEKQYDESYVFVPIDFAEDIMNYEGKRTSVEIMLHEGVKMKSAQSKLAEIVGPEFKVLNSDEQHSGLLKAIKIEKIFVYITFTFILAIASFNIFFSLSMLAIDKKKDIQLLYALGATKNMVKKIFLIEGMLIAFSGALVGLILGLSICILQQEYGLVGMGMQTSVMDAYPIKIVWQDFAFTAISIISITLIASLRPAIIASRFARMHKTE
ncbi:MAG: FtsX-like permease family protein [Cyclobacteriaceae bacterium]|nr:FtsX-like permease family protein [Cyclobacteriaceae bacterium]MCH8515333.1 FtsX-like permease family protein [Cyclobacteriaceae bacterium]